MKNNTFFVVQNKIAAARLQSILKNKKLEKIEDIKDKQGIFYLTSNLKSQQVINYKEFFVYKKNFEYKINIIITVKGNFLTVIKFIKKDKKSLFFEYDKDNSHFYKIL
jgi:hypothetical protein